MCRSAHSHPPDHVAVSMKTTNIEASQCVGRMRLKYDGTRTETRFRLSAKRISPFKSAGASVKSNTGSRGVRISGSNAGYTMFRGSVKGTGYPLHSPVFSFTNPPVRHRMPSHFNWTQLPVFDLLCYFFSLLSSLFTDTLSFLLGWETKFYTRIKRLKF